MLSVSVVSPPPGSSPVKRINDNDYEGDDHEDDDDDDENDVVEGKGSTTKIFSFG